ncbi:Phosphoribosylglycinamide formyltransferase [Cercospora zeina]
MTTSTPTRLTILISGSGTNLQALIDACTSTPPTLPNTRIIRVLSDRKAAYGLTRAEQAQIPRTYFPWLPYKTAHPDDPSNPTQSPARQKYDAALAIEILKDAPHMIVCAGFMRILTPAFLDPIAAHNIPIINLHPALPGDLVGAGCIERAWEEFEQQKREKTGVMGGGFGGAGCLGGG